MKGLEQLLGRNHEIVSVGSTVLVGSVAVLLFRQPWVDRTIKYGISEASRYMFSNGPVKISLQSVINTIPWHWLQNAMPYDFAVFIGISVFFLLLGSLLPDIDHPSSLLGRYVHVAGGHRTWTHTVYFVILFGVLSIWFRPLAWLALGYFWHLFWDSLSYGGVCWFWPFSKYIDYPGGAHVKRKHRIKLYHTGSLVEYIITWLTVFFAFLSVVCVAVG